MRKIILFFLPVILFTSCKKEHLFDCFKSTGEIISVKRNVPFFHSIHMDNQVDLVFHRGYKPELRVTGGANLIEGLVTEINNNTLFIRNENKCNWIRDFNKRPKIDIYCDSIIFVENYGSGNITFADTLFCTDFRYDNWGATGNMDFLFNINHFYCNIHNGTADLVSKGIITTNIFYYNGYGRMNLSGTENIATYITNNGTGDIRIFVANELHARISGTGNIYYSGNPYLVEKEITGTGQLIPE